MIRVLVAIAIFKITILHKRLVKYVFMNFWLLYVWFIINVSSFWFSLNSVRFIVYEIIVFKFMVIMIILVIETLL